MKMILLALLTLSSTGLLADVKMKTMVLADMKGCRVEMAQEGDYHYCGRKLVKFVKYEDLPEEEKSLVIWGDGYLENKE